MLSVMTAFPSILLSWYIMFLSTLDTIDRLLSVPFELFVSIRPFLADSR